MNKEELQKEINELTEELRNKKPTVYKHLMENPVTLPNKDDLKMADALKKYRDNLVSLLNGK